MIFKKINKDLQAFLERDPAAPNKFWIILLWPGFHAIVFHRISHWLWKYNFFKPIARILSGLSRLLTAVDIHPGAKIGESFVIDHATGVVIGETSIIGDNVTIYHNVTLGGVSPSIKSEKQIGVKRHPTIANNVIIGSGASVLGPVKIGENVRIGSNTVVTKNIPDNMTVIGNPARIILKERNENKFQAYGVLSNTPDITMKEINRIHQRLQHLEAKLLIPPNNEELYNKKSENKNKDQYKG